MVEAGQLLLDVGVPLLDVPTALARLNRTAPAQDDQRRLTLSSRIRPHLVRREPTHGQIEQIPPRLLGRNLRDNARARSVLARANQQAFAFHLRNPFRHTPEVSVTIDSTSCHTDASRHPRTCQAAREASLASSG